MTKQTRRFGPPSLRQSPRRDWISTADVLWLITLVFGTGSVAAHYFLTH